jgi:ApaG protein
MPETNLPPYKSQPPRATSSEAVTNNVRVEVESQYAPERSQPFQNSWFFHYTVRITNEGDETVQLLSRHWVATDACGRVEEVKGPGVVGEQPVLGPGESFQYTSGWPLKTSTGVLCALRRRDCAVRALRAVHGSLEPRLEHLLFARI